MVKNLTTEEFKEKVFDYTINKDWKFKGTKPAIIDYFSSWCEPCKTIAPILEKFSEEYKNIDFYKVNTEEQQELASSFGIRSIPSILLIPITGQPQMIQGALSKDIFKKAIGEILLGEKPADQSEVIPEDKIEEIKEEKTEE